MAKPVFGALLLWGHRNIDPERLGSKYIASILSHSILIALVHIRDYDDPMPGGLERKGEKASNGHNNGVSNNTATTTGASTV